MISSMDFRAIKTSGWPRKYFFQLCMLAIVVFFLVAPNRSAHYSYLLLVVACWGIKHDRLPVSWKRFLWLGIPLVIFPILMWQYFPSVWNEVVYWQLGTRTHLLDLDALFKAIPGNDGWMFRVIQTPWLTSYFRWIYANGFTLPVLIPVFRSFLAKDSLKMIRYSLSAHVLQFVLIFPFYLTIHVNEVWYVLGQPDGMARNLSAADAAVTVVNCFPSMHTSIAFAMLLVAWREKDQVFRWVWTLFCLSIIYSTLYLEIHWVSDVIAGIFLALAAVKLGDWIIAKAPARFLTFVGPLSLPRLIPARFNRIMQPKRHSELAYAKAEHRDFCDESLQWRLSPKPHIPKGTLSGEGGVYPEVK